MSARQSLLVVVLAVLALASGIAVWQLRERESPAALVGPPRSDYHVENFELISFDEGGEEAFWLSGPRMARHPQLGTLELEQPRLGMPSEPQRWRGRAERGWVSADADRVRLIGNVELRSDVDPGEGVMRLSTDSLDLLPDEDRAETDAAVTVQGPGSILRGRGLRADLGTREVQLLSEVTGRYEPIRR
ncbi:LPS export ABC transporter periplasmic protein LptC [Pseudomarimonas salicorniae]|uniref:Lipopolysaccharide export system protein LptC n=1 Tax=Pseudomarimonas salicorniae TaxID=2933270 RepID=A0ABT0GFU0_9GAMM|nr:LPS export ABC transporter periplasmic protein LptC [Lysobacter sp. CAU 1642]MCK7593403.1 LPS export ABC transporter periplasmic protein LptC [Lysobacter sp. CAU 1642]